MLPWQSRAIFALLMKECDGAGQIGLGRTGAEGLAAVIGIPVEVVRAGLDGLAADGMVTRGNAVLTIEKFVEAQEATTSNAERQRRFKERRKLAKEQDTPVTRGNAVPAGNDRREETRVEEKKKQIMSATADVGQGSLPGLPAPVKAPRKPRDPHPDTVAVFLYWKQVHGHPRQKLTDDLEADLDAARKTFSVDDLKLAVDGCKASPHHMGQNDRKTVYDGLALILRDVNRFIGYAEKAGKAVQVYDPAHQNLAPVQNTGRVRGEFKFDEAANRKLQEELAAKGAKP
jgi:hypothetical protein